MQILAEPGCEVFKLVALYPVGRSLESKRGLVQSVGSMLKKATEQKSNKVLHEYLDRYAIQIEVYSTPTHLTAQLHCHANFVDKAIPIFFEIMNCAQFSGKYWSLVRRQIVDSIEQQMMQTDFWADKLLSEYLLGSEHPYGYYSQPEDYAKIKVSDIESFYRKFISKKKPQLFLAGDNTHIAKKILIENLSNYDLSAGDIFTKIGLPPIAPHTIEKKVAISTQASVRMGKVISRASMQDFQEIELFNMYLGGYYMSELMKLLRIELSLTYGVYSYVHHFPEVSVLFIGFETDKKNVPTALKAISELFERLYNEKNINMHDAAREYYSQWSKNSEKSLQAIMYSVKMSKLKLNIHTYLEWVKGLENAKNLKKTMVNNTLLDFSTYSKSIVY